MFTVVRGILQSLTSSTTCVRERYWGSILVNFVIWPGYHDIGFGSAGRRTTDAEDIVVELAQGVAKTGRLFALDPKRLRGAEKRPVFWSEDVRKDSATRSQPSRVLVFGLVGVRDKELPFWICIFYFLPSAASRHQASCRASSTAACHLARHQTRLPASSPALVATTLQATHTLVVTTVNHWSLCVAI